MRLVQLDPPGTWCINSAFLEMIGPLSLTETFIEIGPGEGKVSAFLCSKGLKGFGVDFSRPMLDKLRDRMDNHIQAERYSIIEADVMKQDISVQADLVFSIMVLEHIEDDAAFLERMKRLIKPGGKLLICVPARMDKWGIEDELYGHYRRYWRSDLLDRFKQLDLVDIRVWSVAVPIANALLGASNLTIRRSHVMARKALSLSEQTKLSGLKDVPCKTLFPSWVKFVLNRYTMLPFLVLQRLFYNSDIGLSLIACGRDCRTPARSIRETPNGAEV